MKDSGAEAGDAATADGDVSPVDPSDALPLSQHDADERWTVPWANIEGGGGSAELVWCEETLEFHGFTIERAQLYTAEGRPRDPEPSCIDLSLAVASGVGAEPVALWSGYGSLLPAQRGRYLAWLASDKKGLLEDIQYAFLYVYGLERRTLIDKADPELALRVLMRLLKHYGHDPAFFSGVSRFAAFLIATKGIEKLKPAWFARLFTPGKVPLHHDSLAAALTWLHQRKKPLSAELAFEVARQDLRCGRDGAYRADPAAFRVRFEALYRERFGEGLRLTASDRPRTWKYRPINPSLQSWEHFSTLWSVSAPDVLGEAEQFLPLLEIWSACRGEAAPTDWERFIQSRVGAGGRILVAIGDVAEAAGLPVGPGTSLSLAESNALLRAAAEREFDLIPEPRILLRPYRRDDRVVLLRRPEATRVDGEVYYLAGALLLALGAAMAQADGEVDQLEALHVSEVVNSIIHFNEYDKQRLGVLRKRLLRRPPKLASLARRLRAVLRPEERQEAASFLISVAGANYTLGPEERRALARAWRALDMPEEALEARLSALVSGGGKEARGPVDRALLANIMRDSRDFAAHLGRAIHDMTPLEEAEAKRRGVWYVREGVEVERAPEGAREAEPYRDALYALIKSPGWTEEAWIALAREHGVFAQGCLLDSTWWRDVAGEERLIVEDEVIPTASA